MGAGNQIGNGGTEGGFAHYLLVKNASVGESVYKIPAVLSFEQGALVEPLAVAMHAVNRAKPSRGEKAVVFGVGAIGLGAIVCLRQKGITNIVAVDLSQQRLQRAEQLGASAIVSPTHDDLFGFIAEQQGETDFLGFMPVWDTDIFIDAAGAAPVIKTVVDSCKTGARLVVAGLHRRPVEVDFMLLLSKELSLLGSMAYPNEFPEVIAMLADSAVDVSPMISHRFPLAQFSDAFAVARSPAAGAKVIIEID
jgi:2-desacetyl-2-hydroxyethyl bacteriochlorophyllide A dehydrogenase